VMLHKWHARFIQWLAVLFARTLLILTGHWARGWKCTHRVEFPEYPSLKVAEQIFTFRAPPKETGDAR
jgi:hypothetical protein